MARTRAADDFHAIRAHIEELSREHERVPDTDRPRGAIRGPSSGRQVSRARRARSLLRHPGLAQAGIQCPLAERPVLRVGIPRGMDSPSCQ
jgi:hypothetical protein